MANRTINSLIVMSACVELFLTGTPLAHAGGLPVADEPISDARVNEEPSTTSSYPPVNLDSATEATPKEESTPRTKQWQQGRRKRWGAPIPLIVLGAIVLVSWLLAPST